MIQKSIFFTAIVTLISMEPAFGEGISRPVIAPKVVYSSTGTPTVVRRAQPLLVYKTVGKLDKSLGIAATRAALNKLRRNKDGTLLLLPSDVRPAYQLDTSWGGYSPSRGTGKGTTIAIVDAYCTSGMGANPPLLLDTNLYSFLMGLPDVNLQTIAPPGPIQGTDPANYAGWCLETALDVEWAHFVAPEAVIALYIAASDYTDDLLAAVDAAASSKGLVNAPPVSVVSMSWGAPEFDSPTEHQADYEPHFNKPGVSFFAASGDNGSNIIWPATSPSVTAVGGTSLYIDYKQPNPRVAESAWSGAGAGYSAFFRRPAFQQGFPSAALTLYAGPNDAVPTLQARAVPDVAMLADPNTGVLVGESSLDPINVLYEIGGTSLATPMWAAMVAIANAGRKAKAIQPIGGSLNNFLYHLEKPTYAWSNDFVNFNDITVGCLQGFPQLTYLSSNGIGTFSPYVNGFGREECARRGFDFMTGWGTPKAQTLIPALINAH